MLASGTATRAWIKWIECGISLQEGTPLASLGSTNDDRTYERKPGGAFGNGTDTNNNSADFLLNASGVRIHKTCRPAVSTPAPPIFPLRRLIYQIQ